MDLINKNINRGLSLDEMLAGKSGVYAGWTPADDGKNPALKGNDPHGEAKRIGKMLGIDPYVPLRQIGNPTIPQMGASLRGGGGSKMEINGMSIYLMQPNATPSEIGQAIATHVRREFDRRNQMGIPQVSPAWG